MKILPAFMGITISAIFILYPVTGISQPYSQYALQPEQQYYDVNYYGIAIDIDVNSNSINGYTIIKGTVVQNSTAQIVLNFYDYMIVDSVVAQTQNLSFSHANNILSVDLPLLLNQGDVFSLTVFSRGSPHSFSPYSSGMNFLDYQGQRLVYTLNWPYFACSYIPCKDHPSDKADSLDLWITTPDNYTVACTGILDTTITLPGNRKQFVWKTRYPVVPYNISINAYPFDEVFTGYNSPVSGNIPLSFYLFPNHTSTAQPQLETEVPRIIEAFESRFGPFPFASEKFGICELSMFGFGMEHQTLLTMHYDFFFDIELPHEGAHEWFGNMIAIGDWGHIWLSEGFATYSQAIFREYWEGASGYQQEIASHMAGSANGVIYVTEPWDPQNIIQLSLVYRKGSSVLHMLRFVMGDSLFFDMLYDYATISPFRHGNINTEQFTTYCESYYGNDLNWFFDQWIYGDGKMSAEYYYYWNVTADSLIFKTRSIPTTPSSVTTHAMPVPVEFTTGTSQVMDTVWIDSLITTRKYEFMDTTNLILQIDPENKLLKGPFSLVNSPTLESVLLQNDSFHVNWLPFFDFNDYEVHLWREISPGNFTFINSYPVIGFSYSFAPAQSGTYRVAVLGVQDQHRTSFSNYIEIDYTLFPLDQDILIIDETRNGSGGSMLDPTDGAVDSFYTSLLAGYSYQELDVISEGRAPDVFDVSHYKLLIWHYDVIDQTRIQQSVPALQAYLGAGGTIIFSGMKLLNGLDTAFTYPYLGIQNSHDNAQADFTGAVGDLGYTNLPLDTSKITIPSFNNRLRFVSVYDTAVSARSLYRYISHSTNPQFHLKPCGLSAPSVGDSTRSGAISLGFPLFFMDVDSARSFIQSAISELSTITSIGTHTQPQIQTFQLLQNYPNPFNPTTIISWQLPVGNHVELSIYNLRGQKVASLIHQRLPAGLHSLEFDASNLASGVYFYRLEAGAYIDSRKMLLLR